MHCCCQMQIERHQIRRNEVDHSLAWANTVEPPASETAVVATNPGQRRGVSTPMQRPRTGALCVRDDRCDGAITAVVRTNELHYDQNKSGYRSDLQNKSREFLILTLLHPGMTTAKLILSNFYVMLGKGRLNSRWLWACSTHT